MIYLCVFVAGLDSLGECVRLFFARTRVLGAGPRDSADSSPKSSFLKDQHHDLTGANVATWFPIGHQIWETCQSPWQRSSERLVLHVERALY